MPHTVGFSTVLSVVFGTDDMVSFSISFHPPEVEHQVDCFMLVVNVSSTQNICDMHMPWDIIRICVKSDAN